MKSQTSTLKSIQLQFKKALLENSETINGFIKSKSQIESKSRIGIYKYAYVARLIDVLSEDYPLTRKILGDLLFTRICKIFVTKYPSKNFNINSYSLEFPKICIQFVPNKKKLFVKELLDYEKSIVECFYSKNAFNKIDQISLSSLDEKDVSKAVLILNPSVQLKKYQYEIAELRKDMKVVKDTKKVESYTVIYRNNWLPCFLKVNKKQFQILKLIQKGQTFTQIAKKCTIEDLPVIHEWFANWMSLGLFQSIKIK